MIRDIILSIILIFLFAFYYFPAKVNSQGIITQELTAGETFIMAAICRNAIVVGADSRYSFIDRNSRVIAYFEGVQKIYQHQAFLMAISGQSTFDSLRLSGLLKNFSLSHTEKMEFAEFFSEFTKYAKTVLNIKEYTELLENQFLVCGYINTKPIIQYYDGKGKKSKFISSGYITNYDEDNNASWLDEFIKNADQIESIQLVNKVIKRVIDDKNQDTVSSIGGNTSIAYIDSIGVNWVHNQNEYEFYNKKDFFNNILYGKIQMWYRSKEDSIRLRQALIKNE